MVPGATATILSIFQDLVITYVKQLTRSKKIQHLIRQTSEGGKKQKQEILPVPCNCHNFYSQRQERMSLS
jgi:hypothetical protein